MFRRDAILLSPERRRSVLADHAGRLGLIVVGVGKYGERGFQMIYRFTELSEALAQAGRNLAFVYTWDSSRHVMDTLSVASSRLRPLPVVLLDVDDRFFLSSPAACELCIASLGDDLSLQDATVLELDDPEWAERLQDQALRFAKL